MKKYDSIIFGNGFNCAVNYELGIVCDSKYRYLFKLEDFLCRLYEYEKGEYEDEIIKIAEEIWLRAANTNFVTLYNRLDSYYTEEKPIELICNVETRLVRLIMGFLSNAIIDRREILWGIGVEIIGQDIETLESKNWLPRGIYLSNKKKKNVATHLKRLDELLSEIYTLYNVHAIVQNWYISRNLQLEEKRKDYYEKFFKTHLKDDAYIMTTNYGEEIQAYYPNAEHLHGKFISYRKILSADGDSIDKLKIKRVDNNYSFLFGATPVKKHYVVEDGIYDNRFFSDAKGITSRKYGDLLIYGISFAAVHPGLLNPDMTRELFYENIDTHIMKAINDLFKRGKVDSVTIVAYSEEDSVRYKKFLDSFKSSEHVTIGQLYQEGKIRIISEQKFSEERKMFCPRFIKRLKM